MIYFSLLVLTLMTGRSNTESFRREYTAIDRTQNTREPANSKETSEDFSLNIFLDANFTKTEPPETLTDTSEDPGVPQSSLAAVTSKPPDTSSFRTSTIKVNTAYFSSQNSSDCENKTVELRSDLNLGPAINVKGNLSWSNDILNNSECVSEFVVMYRFSNESTSVAAVLCPGYKISASGEMFWCEYSLPDYLCRENIEILLEIWTFNNFMVQPKSEVLVACEETADLLTGYEKKSQEKEDLLSQITTLPTDGEDDSVLNSSQQWQFPLQDGLEDDSSSLNSSRSTQIDMESSQQWQFPLVLASQIFLSSLSRNTSETSEETDVSCSWDTWTTWSPCSLTCGGKGTRRRERTQMNSPTCSKKEDEYQDCITNLCAVDCKWDFWGDWSPCSTSCGLGLRTRIRVVEKEAKFGGKKCGDESVQTEQCIEDTCPVSGRWSPWSRWGFCSKTCGVGSRSRSRSCTEPEPQFGGEECSGANRDHKECYRKDCPAVDGSWSGWGRWTKCSVTCGKGQTVRKRRCTQPAPSGNGRMCTGDRTESNVCFLRNCSAGNSVDLLRSQIEGNIRGRTPTRINTRRPNIRLTTRPKPIPETLLMQESENETSVALAVPRKKCKADQYILGFNDPQPVGSYWLRFNCSKGYVVDTRSNLRHAYAECSKRDGLVNTTQVPVCRPATHCIGPVKEGFLNVSLSFPVRDPKINTPIKIICGSGLVSYGSCFYDGVIRHPNQDICVNEFRGCSNHRLVHLHIFQSFHVDQYRRHVT